MGRKKIVVTVQGMHCAGCAEAVERALRRVAGVLDAKVDYARERAVVTADEEVSGEAVAKAVREAEYESEVVSEGGG